ncbi:MAG: leucine-rich repeat protein, partial [Bacteroidales bacterium]|nr:leucine-rich repeat protein [Bacteroidales bacterium]
IIDNYGSPVNMIFNMPATTVFEKKWFSGLENNFAVTIPTGATGHIPAGYSFTDPYDQKDYDDMVAHGHEDLFWDRYGDRLVEGEDYTLCEESTFVITAENASQIFGQAAVSFQAPTEASNSEWVLWRKSDLKEFPDMSSGNQKVCKDVTVKVNNGVYNTDSGFGLHFESSDEDGVQFVAPEGKVFKRIVILNEYGTFSDPNWSYDSNYKKWSGSANTVGFVGNICGISLIEFEVGDSAPDAPAAGGDEPATTVTWDNTNVFTEANQNEIVGAADGWKTKTKATFEGVTISFDGTTESSSKFMCFDAGENDLKPRFTIYGNEGDSFTFTAPEGKKFSKIEIIDNGETFFTPYGDWTKPEDKKVVWNGTPANAVTLGGTGITNFDHLNSIVFTLAPAAPANSCGGGLTWELNNGELVISYDGEGTGVMNDYDIPNDNPAPWYANREDITSVSLPEGIKTIGKDAFRDCVNLTTVTIPNSVTTIGESAFVSVEHLETVTIGTGITSIVNGAFYGNAELTTVTCSATTPPSIGAMVFGSCPNLEHIYVPTGSVDTYKGAWTDYADKIVAIGSDEPAATVVTITQNDFPEDGKSFTKDGVTVSADWIDNMYSGLLVAPGSFSTTLGNFTKIEVNAGDIVSLGTGWSGNFERQTWTGNASSVSFSGDISGSDHGITIMCTIEPAAPAYETVMNLIEAIGTVELTAECKAKIDAARTAYDALSTDDKALVTNIATLTTAENTYTSLKAAADLTAAAYDLNTLIESAQEDYESVATLPKYASIAEQLLDAINTAKGIAENSEATLSELQTAKTNLQTAYDKFNEDMSGTVTNVDKVNTDASESDVWFDLSGRRLQGKPTTPGLYINNGRKAIVK